MTTSGRRRRQCNFSPERLFRTESRISFFLAFHCCADIVKVALNAIGGMVDGMASFGYVALQILQTVKNFIGRMGVIGGLSRLITVVTRNTYTITAANTEVVVINIMIIISNINNDTNQHSTYFINTST